MGATPNSSLPTFSRATYRGTLGRWSESSKNQFGRSARVSFSNERKLEPFLFSFAYTHRQRLTSWFRLCFFLPHFDGPAAFTKMRRFSKHSRTRNFTIAISKSSILLFSHFCRYLHSRSGLGFFSSTCEHIFSALEGRTRAPQVIGQPNRPE